MFAAACSSNPVTPFGNDGGVTQDVVAAVERLTALGAGPLVGDSYPAHPGHASLTDPAGNVVSIRSALPAKPQ